MNVTLRTAVVMCAMTVLASTTTSCGDTSSSTAPEPQQSTSSSAPTVPSSPPAPTPSVSIQPTPGESSPQAATWIPADFAVAFEAQAASLGASASVGLNDMAGGQPYQVGTSLTPYAYSTIKVALVATLMRLTGGLSPDQEQAAWQALTASDNASARFVYDELINLTGSEVAATAAVGETLALGGDTTTVVPTAEQLPDWAARQAVGVVSTYGQTRWGTGDQAHFTAQLLRGCVLPPDQTNSLNLMMSNVIPSQMWGLGQLAGVGAMKGGWGQDDQGWRYFVRQVGEVQPQTGDPYVIALAVHLFDPSLISTGSVAREAQVLQDLGAWVASQLGPAPAAQPCDAAF